MTAPRFAACECGHPKQKHDVPGFDGECVADGCKCRTYRPNLPRAVSSVPTAALAQPIETPEPPAAQALRVIDRSDVITLGKKSPVKRTVALAEKAEQILADLTARLDEEKKQEAARAEIARLERQLAAAKAKLASPTKTSTPKTSVGGDGECPDCGKTGLANVGVHRAKAHGYRREVSA